VSEEVPRPWLVPLDRRLLLAGLGLTVLGGTAMGAAHLLWVHVLGWPSPYSHVQVHAHAQLFGFLGAFLTGFGMFLLPRFVRRVVPCAPWAKVGPWLIVAGASLHLLGQPIARYPLGRVLWAASAPLLALGGVAFACVVVRLVWGYRAREGFTVWVGLGGALFGVSCLFGAALAGSTAYRGALFYDYPAAQAVWHFALYIAALTYVLGIAARLVPSMLGVPKVAQRPYHLGMAVLVLAGCAHALSLWVVLPSAGWSALRSVSGGVQGLALATLGALFVLLPAPVGAVDLRFKVAVRFAFGSLCAAGAAKVALAVAPSALGRPLHLLADAERHLVTVGFLLVLIAAMAPKLLPAPSPMPSHQARLWWAAALLLMGAVVLRSVQALADFGLGAALWAAAASGVVAWVGLLTLMAAAGLRVRALRGAP
jgi:uncharacterized protein involved in response to NO